MQGNHHFAEGDASNGIARTQSTSGALVTRPPYCRMETGTTGKAVELVANCVGVEQCDVVVRRGHVEFNPPLNSKALRHLVLKQQHIQNEIGDAFIFDGTTLYLTGDNVFEGTLAAQHPTNSEEINVRICPFSALSQDDPQTIKCYNIVVRSCIEMVGLKRLGRNYFDEQKMITLKEYDMEIWPGFEAAVRQNEKGLMLCIENRFKTISTQSVWDIITHEYQRMQRDHKKIEARMEEILDGQFVFTRYNCKLFRVAFIDYDLSPATTFTHSDGSKTSIKDYLERTYNLRVTQLTQPVIVSKIEAKQPDGVTRNVYLLPEFCFLTGITESMKKDHRHMKELTQHMRLDPEKRRRKIDDLLERIHNNGRCRTLLQKWGIELEEKLVTFQSRELKPEKLIGHATDWHTGERAEWSRIMRNSVVFRPVDIHNWMVITPSAHMAKTLAIQFIEEVKHLGESMRIDVDYPMLQLCSDTTPTSYRIALLEAMQRAADQPIRMVVILLPDDNKTRYDLLKLWLCTETDIPSQCVQLSTLRGHPRDGGRSKNFTAIIVKIVLQMICKMGGALWKVNIPIKSAMFVGYDVYRDSTLRGKTIGACVSTFDLDYTKFYSQARPHDDRADLGTNLRFFIKRALYEYYINNNRTLPQKIFLYRDGVDDGQIPLVKEQEVLIVQQACVEMTKDFGFDPKLCPIRLAFVIVTKKVNVRVFKRDPDTFLRNPNPGTVVDSVVTRTERFDFYLVPQHVNQGTVTPVCYNVIYDDTGLRPDQHHKLAFKLSHLFYNWQGTVRVPAPCQYAHKLAFMVAQSIQTNVKEDMNVTKELRNKLFFL